MAVPDLRQQDLRYTPGTREYDEEQAMWRLINAARSQTMSYLGTAPAVVLDPADFAVAA